MAKKKQSISDKSKVSQCPYCTSRQTLMVGISDLSNSMRLEKHLCETCGGTFARPHVTGRFTLGVILEAISLYNMGLSLEDVIERMGKSKMRGPSAEQLMRWIEALGPYAPFLHIRDRALSRVGTAGHLIESRRLIPRDSRHFAYHLGKINYVLDRRENERFLPIKMVLESASALFRAPRTGGRHGSHGLSTRFEEIFDLDVRIAERRNYACDTIQLLNSALGQRPRKNLRDEIQRYFLINDTSTMAINVPLTLYRDDLDFFHRAHGFCLPSETDRWPRSDAFTGYVDFLQIRGDRVHLVKLHKDQDAKSSISRSPGSGHLIQELTLLAMALSRRTGIRLYEMSCAWFDHKGYFEFQPLGAIRRVPKGQSLGQFGKRVQERAEQDLHAIFKKGA